MKTANINKQANKEKIVNHTCIFSLLLSKTFYAFRHFFGEAIVRHRLSKTEHAARCGQ
jgi:hypothetical protein